MSSVANLNNKNKNKNKINPLEKIEKLALLTKQALVNEQKDRELSKFISQLFNEGNGDLISETIHKIRDMQELDLLINYSSACIENNFMFETEDAGYQYWTFAIPIFLIGEKVDIRKNILSMERNKKILDKISESFVLSGLLRPEAEVYINDYLYSHDELLNASFQHARDFPVNLIKKLSSKKVSDEKLLKDSSIEKIDDDQFYIRYLVGNVIDNAEIGCFLSEWQDDIEIPAHLDEQAQEDLISARLEGFSNMVRDILAPALGINEKTNDCSVLEIMPLYSAVGVSLADSYRLQINTVLEVAKNDEEFKPNDKIIAVVSSHYKDDNKNTIQVGFQSKNTGEIICGTVVCFSDLIHAIGSRLAADQMSEIFADLEVEEVIQIDGVHPTETCDCCDKEVFMTHKTEFQKNQVKIDQENQFNAKFNSKINHKTTAQKTKEPYQKTQEQINQEKQFNSLFDSGKYLH
jgi:hypothetical protein